MDPPRPQGDEADMATDTSTSTNDDTTSGDNTDTGKNGTGSTDTDDTTGSGDGTDDDALTAENAAKWREMARKHEKQNGKLAAELEELRAKSMSEQEKAIEQAKAEGRAEARAEALADMVSIALDAAAGEKLADPTFVRLLSDDDREAFVTKDGKVDRKAIGSALDALVKKHPNLAKSGKPGPLPGGGKTSGAGGFDMNDEIRRQARRG